MREQNLAWVCQGSFSTKWGCPGHVRLTPDSDGIADVPPSRLRAMRHSERPMQARIIYTGRHPGFDGSTSL
jgi:hypothetical protein